MNKQLNAQEEITLELQRKEAVNIIIENIVSEIKR